MQEASAKLEFEAARGVRDQINSLPREIIRKEGWRRRRNIRRARVDASPGKSKSDWEAAVRFTPLKSLKWRPGCPHPAKPRATSDVAPVSDAQRGGAPRSIENFNSLPLIQHADARQIPVSAPAKSRP